MVKLQRTNTLTTALPGEQNAAAEGNMGANKTD